MIWHQENGKKKNPKTMRYHCTPFRMSKVQNIHNIKCKATELLFISAENAKQESHFGRQLVVYCKTNHTVIIQYSDHGPGHLPKEVELCTKTCSRMMAVALFIIANTCKQSKYVSVGDG